MRLPRNIFRLVFGCHHWNLSRVFTIHQRTYQVCLDCGHEVEYSWALMRAKSSHDADDIYSPLFMRSHTEVPTI
jgi:hypothetical protein